MADLLTIADALKEKKMGCGEIRELKLIIANINKNWVCLQLFVEVLIKIRKTSVILSPSLPVSLSSHCLCFKI